MQLRSSSASQSWFSSRRRLPPGAEPLTRKARAGPSRMFFAWTYCTTVFRGSAYLPRGTKFKAAEFMQKRNPVGGGPSSKTCPRCASHRLHRTSSLCIPSEPSLWDATFSFAMGFQKLGQPVPDSNFVLESNRTVLQQMQWYSPSSWLLAYLPVNARSVPA